MGGGGAMRAATKVVTFGVAAGGGLRGASVLQSAEQSSSSVTPPRASRPSAAIVSDGRNSFSVPVQRPPIDDWEFAGGSSSSDEEEEYLLPRVVFGGVPSYQEAKDATSDLKEAVHKEYFSSALSRSGHSESKDYITNEKAVLHSSVPKPIFQAFSLLTESPEAQGVVTSLASDKNVWDAVMKNEKVMDFIKWQQTSSISDIDANIEQPFLENNKISTKSSDDEEESPGNEFIKFLEKLKMTVTDMVSSLSGFFQNLFGGENNNGISIDENGNAAVKTGIGASFMALAVMAIMVAVLKRA
ncbi:hypothetical protein ACHQM5_025690 [Ranunculus cassubicifolius]